MSAAAKWHRHWAAEMQRVLDKAQRGAQRRGADDEWKQDAGAAEGRVAVQHHAAAADCMEALAVPGIADRLDRLARGRTVIGEMLPNDVRAALATLAKIARGE